jgi:DNA-directed RNA polymerase specialized sigma24 family protein
MDDFEKFLNWLDTDPNRAGIKYEDIRRRLIRFFICRGCGVDSEALADQSMERVIKKIQILADSYQGDPVYYFFGVARNVYREWLDEQIKRSTLSPPPPGESSEQKELLDRYLEKCLSAHSEGERKLILSYYSGERQQKIVNRKELSQKLGIGANALRLKVHRIRTELRKCVEECLERDLE